MSYVTIETLQTIITEIKAIINDLLLNSIQVQWMEKRTLYKLTILSIKLS